MSLIVIYYSGRGKQTVSRVFAAPGAEGNAPTCLGRAVSKGAWQLLPGTDLKLASVILSHLIHSVSYVIQAERDSAKPPLFSLVSLSSPVSQMANPVLFCYPHSRKLNFKVATDCLHCYN